MEGVVTQGSLSIVLLFSVWNLLILAAVWRVSARAVERVHREGALQASKAARKPRASKDAS